MFLYIFALFFVSCLNTHVVTDLVTLLPREFNLVSYLCTRTYFFMFTRARAGGYSWLCSSFSRLSPLFKEDVFAHTHIRTRAQVAALGGAAHRLVSPPFQRNRA